MRGRTLLAVLLCLLPAGLAAQGEREAEQRDPGPDRARVARRKALFIEQFTRLVGWPRASLPQEGPFILCTLGSSDTADELANIASFVKFKQRPCEVRALSTPAQIDGCHLLYLAASAAPVLPQALAAVADRPVLTVSDTAGFAGKGVEFNLFEEARSTPQPGVYVGFELNVAAIKRSVLAFDPRLLTAGRRVGGGRRDGGVSP
jgi:hypothetical protein